MDSLEFTFTFIMFKQFPYTACAKRRGERLYKLLSKPRSKNDMNLKLSPEVYLDKRWKLITSFNCSCELCACFTYQKSTFKVKYHRRSTAFLEELMRHHRGQKSNNFF